MIIIGKGMDFGDDRGKLIELESISKETEVTWARNECNPDHKLGIISAANKGFQSKMDSRKGSYMTRKFIEKMLYDFENRTGVDTYFLHEIMDEIQQELEEEGKQLIETKYNNKTQYVKFKVYEESDGKAGKNELLRSSLLE